MTSINIGDFGTATSTAAAATINHTQGTITTEALTTASGSTYDFTLTNNCINANSIVLVSPHSGTNTRLGPMSVGSIVPAAGSVVFKVLNGHASALNGTLVIDFVVL